LHLVDDGVGQRAGRLPGKQGHLGVQQAREQALSQRQHAFVGDAREGVLSDKLGHAAHGEQAHQRHGHDPQLQLTLAEAAVQQGFEQGGNQRLGQCGDHRRQKGNAPCQTLLSEMTGQPGQPLHQRAFRGRVVRTWDLHDLAAFYVGRPGATGRLRHSL
jgi:hypothetical protein